MSGHSHWQNIRAKKEAEDAKKSKIFSKFSRLISVAAREGGGDLEKNPKLKDVVEKAKGSDVPSATIERAIKRGTGEIEGVEYEEVLFEVYGPGGAAFIIETITDNRNRTVSEIKNILKRYDGKLAEPGSVCYLFDRKGSIILEINSQPRNFQDKDELELAVIDAGAEDLFWRDGFMEIYTNLNDLEKVKKKLKEKGIVVSSATDGWQAKNEISVSDEVKNKIDKFFEELDEHDDVQEIYSNTQ